MLECYGGFRKKPSSGRYGNLKSRDDADYYGVKLLKTYPLDKLPAPEKFNRELERLAER